jgi:arabinogalactan oligomer / maltooligosaccharide transport system permease protein
VTATATRSGRREGSSPSRRPPSLAVIIIKIVLLGLLDALAVLAIVRLADNGDTVLAVIAALATVGINWIYLTPRAVPLKYLAPGTVFFVMFLVYPVGYNVFLSTTNYGTGNILSKEQAVTQVLDRATVSPTEGRRFDLNVLVDRVTSSRCSSSTRAGSEFLGTNEELVALEPADVERDPDGDVVAVGEYRAINLAQASDRQREIVDLEVPTETGVIKVATFTSAAEREKTIVYDADARSHGPHR